MLNTTEKVFAKLIRKLVEAIRLVWVLSKKNTTLRARRFIVDLSWSVTRSTTR